MSSLIRKSSLLALVRSAVLGGGGSGHVVLLLLDAAGARGCGGPLHGVGGRVQRGAGGRLARRPVVDQVLKIASRHDRDKNEFGRRDNQG
jgi:hypothetical protein